MHLGGENARIFGENGKSKEVFTGQISRKTLRTELERCILKAGPKFQRAEPNIKGVVRFTS